ncbi:hypothetical protein ACLKA6_013043 [Drosophila palustris]
MLGKLLENLLVTCEKLNAIRTGVQKSRDQLWLALAPRLVFMPDDETTTTTTAATTTTTTAVAAAAAAASSLQQRPSHLASQSAKSAGRACGTSHRRVHRQ